MNIGKVAAKAVKALYQFGLNTGDIKSIKVKRPRANYDLFDLSITFIKFENAKKIKETFKQKDITKINISEESSIELRESDRADKLKFFVV